MFNLFESIRWPKTIFSLVLILAQISSSAFAVDFAEKPGSVEPAPEIIHQNIVETSLGTDFAGTNLDAPLISGESLKENGILKTENLTDEPGVLRSFPGKRARMAVDADLNQRGLISGKITASEPLPFKNSNKRLKDRAQKITMKVKSVLKAWGKPMESIFPPGLSAREISRPVLSLPSGDNSRQIYAEPLNQRGKLVENTAPTMEPPSSLSLGLKQTMFSVGVGCLMLAWWGVATFLALHMGYVPHSNYHIPQISPISAFWAGFLGPMVEELGFRVGMFDGLRWAMLRGGGINPRKALMIAAAISSLIFVALHETADPVYFGIRLVSSLLFILAYRKAGWAGSSIAHITNNLGFLASKSGMTLAPLIVLVAILGSILWGLLVWLKILPANMERKSLFWGSAWEWRAARRSKR